MRVKRVGWGLAALMVAALAGCGGGGGGGDGAAAPAPGGGPAAPAAAAVPTGAAPITLSAATPAATFAALAPVVTVGGVTISSPPCVSFSIADSVNNAIIGFGSKSQSATATVASYPNLAFSLAKLVPGTNGSPAKWVSYIVTTVPTKNATTGAITASVPTRPTTDNTGTLTDNKNGTYTYCFYRDITKVKDEVAAATLTAPNVAADLGDLTYDPNALHRLVIIVSGNAPGTGTNTSDGVSTTTGVPMQNPINVIYDFIPATGKAVSPTDTSVTQRLIVDRLSCNECHGKLGGIPGTESASFHGGARYDPKLCVVCHTDQRKYGRDKAVSTNNAFPALTKTVNATTGAVSYSPFTYVADGVTVGDFPVLIHRIHKGEDLIKQNYNFANVLVNETKFPQDIRNCTKCHDTTSPKVAPQGDNWKMVPSRLACGACHDGIDYSTGKGTRNILVPQSDGTLAHTDTTGHIGGRQTDDSKCALCHDSTAIPTYHVPVTPPNPASALHVAGGSANTNSAYIASDPSNLPTGAIKVTYSVKSVSRNSSKQPVIVFCLQQNGACKNFNTFDSTKSVASQEIWDNFFGAPSVFFVWAVPQDGITAPADFNVSASGYIRSLWNKTATGTGAGTLSDPDSSGYYTATLTGVSVPDNAVMLSGGIGYTYNVTSSPPLTQTNVQGYGNNYYPSGYPATASTVTGLNANMPNKIGGLIVVAPDQQMVATGYTGRRSIVEDARCNKCHRELGVFRAEAFHGGQRNDGTTCAWCHNPNRTSSGWSADSSYYIHAIHAADKRNKPFTWHASAATTEGSFAGIGFPGVLSNCETCHVSGAYDFSAAANNAALPNRLYRTVATGSFAASGASYTMNNRATASTSSCGAASSSTTGTALSAFSLSPYITQSTSASVVDYGASFVFNAAATGGSNSTGCSTDSGGTAVAPPGTYTFYSVAPQGTRAADPTTLVNSPIANACFSCHDSDLDKQHMESNGGSIYRARGTPGSGGALDKAEQCTLCHLSGKVADIKAMHPSLPKPVSTP